MVPKANLLARPGDGFKLAMQTFDATRPDIAMGAVGLMRAASTSARATPRSARRSARRS